MDAAEKQHCFLSVTLIESMCVSLSLTHPRARARARAHTHTHTHTNVSNDEVWQEIHRMPSLLADAPYKLYVTRSKHFYVGLLFV